MRVLHVSEVFWPHIGGIETALSTLFRSTPEIEHVVLTNAIGSGRRTDRYGRNVLVHRLPPDDGLAAAPSRLLPRSERAATATRGLTLLAHLLREFERRRLAKSEAPEVVHIHSAEKLRHFLLMDRRLRTTLGRTLVDWWLDASAYPAPLLFTDHSLFGASRRQFDETFAGEIVRRLANIICVEVSGYENVRAFARENGLARRIWYVPNPVDTDAFPWAPLPSKAHLIVGYVGRAERAGIDTIQRIASQIPDWMELHLALAGPPRDIRGEWQVSREAVRVFWNTPNDKMAKFYRGIDLLLDPWSFGAPRTALEALSTGRPVLRLRRGRDFVEDLPEDISPIVDPNPETALSALERLHSHRSELSRLAEASRDIARSRFDARVIADAHRKVYSELTSGR